VRGRFIESAAVLLCAALLSALAVTFIASRGYTLYFGDAEAHLNIARRMLDSRTPGIEQAGTVWLPLPHLLMLPFVRNDAWWHSGIAGSIPSALAFIAACVLLYAAARRLFASRLAAATALALFALNPNVLYLQSIPMTEALFFASLAGLLYATVLYAQTGSPWAVALAGAFSNAASMTRYEGWFLIPFVALFFWLQSGWRKWYVPGLFCALAALFPIVWFAYNWWHYSNALEFYNGPYSARAIYERSIKAGGARAPGDGNWMDAIRYFSAAARLCAGAPLAWIGLAGALALGYFRRWWTLSLLAIPPIFYIWSLHSSGTPIFVPHLWPNSYYNTRYGTTAMLLFAFGGAALVAALPVRFRTWAASAVVLAALSPWLFRPTPDAWIVWKESQVNSESRRAWTRTTAHFLQKHHGPGEGIFTAFGDLTGIFREARIPLREILHEGNNPHWNIAARRADWFLLEEWAVAFSGDPVATAVQRGNHRRPVLYELVATIQVPHAPVVEVYRRRGGFGAVPDLCRRGLIPDCDAPALAAPPDEAELLQ
jgi:hypothetical protein